MTESTASGSAEPVFPDQHPTDPPADPPKAPAKKAAAKKTAAAKKVAAPAPKKKDPSSSLYLPALPEGFAYDRVVIVGPGEERITLATSEVVGSNEIDVDVTGSLTKTATFDDMHAAAKAAGKAAKAMSDVVKREKELAALREQALDL